jgi:hypothetical protein
MFFLTPTEDVILSLSTTGVVLQKGIYTGEFIST